MIYTYFLSVTQGVYLQQSFLRIKTNLKALIKNCRMVCKGVIVFMPGLPALSCL